LEAEAEGLLDALGERLAEGLRLLDAEALGEREAETAVDKVIPPEG